LAGGLSDQGVELGADFEDRLFHCVLPLLAYAALAVAGFAILPDVEITLFAIGAAALVLLFCGIHNAWDAVAYHTFVHTCRSDKDEP
jgi:hypothetical protein